VERDKCMKTYMKLIIVFEALISQLLVYNCEDQLCLISFSAVQIHDISYMYIHLPCCTLTSISDLTNHITIVITSDSGACDLQLQGSQSSWKFLEFYCHFSGLKVLGKEGAERVEQRRDTLVDRSL